MFDHDHAVTIAGLRAERDSLIVSLRAAIDDGSTSEERLMRMIAEAELACVTAERDALAAQLAEVRAKLDAAPKVCAIHSYEHGAWLRLMTAIDPNATITDDALRSLAERTTAQVTADREVARLTARVAELEARPVVTEAGLSAALDAHGYVFLARKVFAHLGPVTLPAQDRAEELVSAWRGICTDTATCDLDPAERMRRAIASLGAPPTSPPAARPVFAGVSEEELALEYARAVDRIPGIRAVLARLEVSLVAPVDPEVVARRYHDHKESPVPEWPYAADHYISSPIGADHEQARLRATAAMRATLTAAGIPVTPEVGK